MASHRMLGQPKVGGHLHNTFPPTGRYGGPSAADANAARDAATATEPQQQAGEVPATDGTDQ